MPAGVENLQARATPIWAGETLAVVLGGTWQITDARPSWSDVLGGRNPTRLELRVEGLDSWDSSLPLFVYEAQQWARVAGVYCDVDALPAKVRALAGQLASTHETSVPFDRSESFLTSVGVATQDIVGKARDMSRFVGECVL